MEYIDKLESLTDLVAIMEQVDANEQSRSDSQGNVKFTGCTYQECVHMALHGWQPGAEKAKRMLSKLVESIPQEESRTGTYHDVTGSYVDVGEYVQGIPECMVEFKEDKRRARVVDIIVSATYSCEFKPSQAIQRGVSIAAVIDLLETRGVRCNVSLVFAARGYGETRPISHMYLSLKRAEEPMNLDKIAYAIAHPSYLRRLVFAYMESKSPEYREQFSVGGTYGMPMELETPEGSIVFQTPSSRDPWNEAYAVNIVNKVMADYLKSQGEAI